MYHALSEIECENIVPIDITRLGSIKPVAVDPAVLDTSLNGAGSDLTQHDMSVDRAGTNVPDRPVRCVLQNSIEKSQILRNATKMRNSVTIRYNLLKIFFIPDQTKLERDDDKELRTKLQNMKARNPDKQYMIKNKRVVEREEHWSPTRRHTTSFSSNH